MKRIIIWAILAGILSIGLMTSCSSIDTSSVPDSSESSAVTESSEINAPPSSTESSTSSTSSTTPEEDTPSSEGETSDDAIGGAGDACQLHCWNYHSITSELISYVGTEEFEAWLETVSGEDVNIVRFVSDFQIDRETFDGLVCYDIPEDERDGMTLDEIYTLWSYNQEMRDAIYSNDAYEISEAFVSEYAVVATDGQIYTLEWLAEHDGEDYVSYGLPAEKIEATLDYVLERDYTDQYTEIAEQIKPTLEEVYTLEEASVE